MPREFQDFSQEVSSGTDKIKTSLDAVRGAADRADSSSGSLSKTQDAGTRIADSYSKTMAGVSRELSRAATGGTEAARGLSMADASVRVLGASLSSIRSSSNDATSGLGDVRDVSKEVASALESISGKKININFDVKAAMAAGEIFKSLDKRLATMEKRKIKVEVDAGESQKVIAGIQSQASSSSKATTKAPKTTSTLKVDDVFSKNVEKEIKSLQKELATLDKIKRSLTKGEKIQLLGKTVALAEYRELLSFMESADLTTLQRSTLALRAETAGLGVAVGLARVQFKELDSNMSSAGDSATEAATASKKYTGEVEKAKNVTELLNNKFQEGKKEAKGFAGGLGVTNGRLIGAGVAMLFVASKAGEMIGKFKDAAVELAGFNVKLAVLDKRAAALGFDQTFGEMRDEMHLTRKEAGEFFDVLRKGAQSGVIETNKLTEAAHKLQATFGGDPTKRLEEYISLLEMIPTLEADLSITASMDDQASSIFALAQAGKIETVMELQSAGLLGGVEGDVSPEQVELLNAQHKTEKTMEDIHDTLLNKFFPAVGPQLSALVGGTTKVVMAIGGVAAGLGVLSALGGAQVAAQNVTTGAVLTTGGMKNVGSAIKGLKKDLPSTGLMKRLFGGLSKKLAGRAAAKAAMNPATAAKVAQLAASGMPIAAPVAGAAGTAGAGAAGAGGLAATAGALIASPVVIAVAVAALAVGIGYVGSKLTSWGDELEEEGKMVQAGFAKVTGAGLKAGVALALLGPIVGPLVALAWAGEDAGEGLKHLGKSLQGSVGGMKKFGPVTRAMGGVMIKTGEMLSTAGSAIKQGFKNLWGGLKQAASATMDFYASMFRASKVNDALDAIAMDTRAYNATLNDLRETGKKYDAAIGASQQNRMKSGLALQRNLKGLEAAVNSAKIQFYNLSAEIAKMEFEAIGQLGGSVGQFHRAIETSVSAIKKRFSELGDATQKRRMQVERDIKSGELSGADARGALMRIKQEEIKASKEFVEGMMEAAKAMFKSPKIIEEGLRRESASIDFDLGLEEGIGGMDALAKTLEKGFNAQLKEQEFVLEAGQKAGQKVAEARKKLEQISKSAVEIFKDNMSELPKAAQDALKGIKYDSKGIADVDSLNSALDNVSVAAESATKNMNDAAAALPSESFSKAAMEYAAASKSLLTAQKVSGKARKKVSKLQKDDGADPEELAAAEKSLSESQKREQDFMTKKGQLYEKLNERVKKDVGELGKSINGQKAINNLIESIGKGEAITAQQMLERKDISKASWDMAEAIQKTEESRLKATSGDKSALEKYHQAITDFTSAMATKGALEGLEKGVTSNVAAWEFYVSAQKEVKRVVENAAQVAEQVAKLGQVGLGPLKRNLEIEQSKAAMAQLTGDVAKNVNAVRESELQLAEKTLSNTNSALSLAKKQRAAQAKALKGATTKAEKVVLTNQLGSTDKAIADLSQQRAKAMEAIGDVGSGIDKALSEFENTLSGKRIAQQMELSEVQADLASFAKDLNSAIAESTAGAISAAKERAMKEKKILAEATKEDIGNLERRAAAMDKAKPGSGKAFLQDAKTLVLAKDKTKQAQIELREKRAVVQAAQREASLKLEAIGLEEELISAEADFLSEIGGSFSSILKLQQAGVALEQQKLSALQDQVDTARASGATGLEMRKMEVALEKQKFSLHKKSFGVQKDIYEKLLGKAFGEMSSDIGAATRRGSDVGMLGRDRTRVKSRSGLYMKTGPGGPGTLAERAADRALKGAFGGMGGGDTAGKGLSGEAPERIDIEKEIAKDGKTTAEATKSIEEHSTKKGSLYTHDVYSESWLSKIHAVLKANLLLSNDELVAAKVAQDKLAELASKKTQIEGSIDEVEKRKSHKNVKKIQKQPLTEEHSTKKGSLYTHDVYSESWLSKIYAVLKANLLLSNDELVAAKVAQDKLAELASKKTQIEGSIDEVEKRKSHKNVKKIQKQPLTEERMGILKEMQKQRTVLKKISPEMADALSSVSSTSNPQIVESPGLMSSAKNQEGTLAKVHEEAKKQMEKDKGGKAMMVAKGMQSVESMTKTTTIEQKKAEEVKLDKMTKAVDVKKGGTTGLNMRKMEVALEKQKMVVEKASVGQAEQGKTLGEQLSIARKNYKEQMTIAQNLKGKDAEGSKKAMGKAEAELNKISTMEKSIRKSEMRNPFGGGGSGPDMRRILSGKVAPEEESYMKVQESMSKRAAKASESSAGEAKKMSAKDDIWKKPKPVDWKAQKKNIMQDRISKIMTENERGKIKDDLDKGMEYDVRDGEIFKNRQTEYGNIQSHGGQEETDGLKRIKDNAQYMEELIGKPMGNMAEAMNKGTKDTINTDKKLAKDVTKTTPTEVVQSKGAELNKVAVPAVSDTQSKEEVLRNAQSTSKDIGGLGKGSSQYGGQLTSGTSGGESASMKVMGQINITMDTKMFRAQMSNLVAETIGTPEVRGALNKEGYLNSR